MNFDNCALYVDRILNSNPDRPTEIAAMLSAWFFESALESVEEFTDDSDRQLHLMGAPGACADLLLLTAGQLLKTLAISMNMSDDEPYAGQFAWDEEVREVEPGLTQAFHMADVFMSDPDFKPSQWPETCSHIGMVLLALASTFKMPDQKTLAISIIGVVPDAIHDDLRETIADGIMSLIRENGVPIDNAMIQINQINN